MQTLSSSMESQGLFLFPSVAEGCTIRGRGMARNPGISGAGLGWAGQGTQVSQVSPKYSYVCQARLF